MERKKVMNMTDKYNIVGMRKELQRDTIKRYSRRRMKGVKSRDVTPEEKKLKPLKVGKGKHGRDITPELVFYQKNRQGSKYPNKAVANKSFNINVKSKDWCNFKIGEREGHS